MFANDRSKSFESGAIIILIEMNHRAIAHAHFLERIDIGSGLKE